TPFSRSLPDGLYPPLEATPPRRGYQIARRSNIRAISSTAATCFCFVVDPKLANAAKGIGSFWIF
ncbi:hypothetical protein LWS69_36100, partial [Bordetella hinzii]|nr:hypothetical protein [Bordetella hinzii]